MSHPRPFYYLENFRTALDWLRTRYGDLLNESEWDFISRFPGLPLESAALLVRMVGRQGELFRTSRLRYDEIGCPLTAAAVLIELGWVDSNPLLAMADLGKLLRKPELHAAFGVSGAALGLRKPELLEWLGLQGAEPRSWTDWWARASDVVFRLRVSPLCERLRLLFFGNFRQDWSQFVLTDLGIFRYEKVAGEACTRAFQSRQHIDTFHALFECRKLIAAEGSPESILARLPPAAVDNEWLEGRRQKLQFQIAQACERKRDLVRALEVYRTCSYAGSRLRQVRLLELLGEVPDALRLAETIQERPADDIETQQISRMLPRLQRKSGLKVRRVPPARDWVTFDAVLPIGERPDHLERATAEALSQPDAPVLYVENSLINSLFGLLCWEAIFAPIAGAFFHQFQSGPADLHAAGFRQRRAAQLAQCLGQLESEAYRDTIRLNFRVKSGIQSPFVFWGLLDEPLLELALDCLPRQHLRACFERILENIRCNRSGLPDLIQFWPAQRRYRLIEVKGPGDRLQDNQLRWLGFCHSRGIPVSLCHVSWLSSATECGTAPA